MADTDLGKELENACMRGGGRVEILKEQVGETVQCITEHGKLEIDHDNREGAPTTARGQSITEETVKMKGTINGPKAAHYDRLNDRIVVMKTDGSNLSIHNDKDKGGY